jgi:hypothetical protein
MEFIQTGTDSWVNSGEVRTVSLFLNNGVAWQIQLTLNGSTSPITIDESWASRDEALAAASERFHLVTIPD